MSSGGSPDPSNEPISLVPADVWASYQEEVSSSAELAVPPTTASSEDLEQVGDEELDISVEAPVRHMGPADRERAVAGLSRVELFTGLAPERLEQLARVARLVEVGAGATLFGPKDSAKSFFVVLEGDVELFRKTRTRELLLRTPAPGEPVGLFSLFYSHRRNALCRAKTDAALLEIPRDSLEWLLAEDSGLRARVLRFYEERLVWGFVAVSAHAAQLEPMVAAKAVAQFHERHVVPGEALVQPGEVVNLLAVVVNGALHLVAPPRPGEKRQVYSVLPGQFVAVTSALLGEPCRMRIHAPESTTLMVLEQSDVTALIKAHPGLRQVTSTLDRTTRRLDRGVYCGDTNAPGA